MFSATISREVMDISWVYQRDPEEITVRADEQNKPDILQYAVTVEQTDKVAAMARIIRQEKLERVMVFCNTKGMVERLTKYLEMEGLDAACIHGDIPQKKREQVMARFRRGELPVFVATDVAARGIDVDDVDAVFNYDVPQENEYYVHRIGRTARASATGRAITFVSEKEQGKFHQIEKFIERDIRKAELPESVGEGPKYAPDENRGRFGRGRGGRSGGGRSGSGRGRGGRGDRSGRNDRDRRSERPAAATAAAAAEPAAAQPASPDSDHASGRGEGNRGTRDRRRHRGGRNRGRGNKPQGGEPTPQA